MATETLVFGGTAIGDVAQRYPLEVHRAQSVAPASAALRDAAVLFDESPNLYYLLRVEVAYKAASGRDLALWTANMGALMAAGKQTAQITGDNSFSLPDAVLVGPVAPPANRDRHPGVVESMEFVFVSVKPPEA